MIGKLAFLSRYCVSSSITMFFGDTVDAGHCDEALMLPHHQQSMSMCLECCRVGSATTDVLVEYPRRILASQALISARMGLRMSYGMRRRSQGGSSAVDAIAAAMPTRCRSVAVCGVVR
jgi:hypothetical protein